MESKVIVYSATMCGHCLKLKDFLDSNNIAFEEKNIGTAEYLTELRVNGCFSMQAPILRIRERFITDKELFEGEEIRGEVVEEMMRITLKDTGTE